MNSNFQSIQYKKWNWKKHWLKKDTKNNLSQLELIYHSWPESWDGNNLLERNWNKSRRLISNQPNVERWNWEKKVN